MVDTLLVRGCQTVLKLVTSRLITGWQVVPWFSNQGAYNGLPADCHAIITIECIIIC